MPILYPDILEHNNSAKALVDITQLRGSSYPLGVLSETGSIPTDKRKLGAIIFVSSSQEFYGFYGQTTGSSDWDNTGNWRTLSTFSGSFTGSLLGTSSYSTQALSSSYALTASFALNGGGTTVDTGSFVTTSSFNSFTSSINAATSSFVTNSQTSSFIQNNQTGSFVTTASVNLNTVTFTKGNGTTFPITVNTGSVPTLAQVTAAGATTTTTMRVGLLSSSAVDRPGSNLNLAGNAAFPSSFFNFSYEGNAGSCMLGQQDLRGEDDIIFQALPGTAGRFGVFEAYNSAGVVLGTGGNNSPVIFQIDRNERARLASSGNFLIGTSSDSGFKLDVNGSFRTTSTINANLANVTSSNVVYYNTASGLFTYGTINTASFVSKIIAGSSISVSPESGLGDVTVSYIGGGGVFPFTGSALISGSIDLTGSANILGLIDLNGPLNANTRDFNINNDTVVQNAPLQSSSISLNTYSNQVSGVNREWNFAWSISNSITSGSTFTVTNLYDDNDPTIGTKVFYSGSESDSYGIPSCKFLGVVLSRQTVVIEYDEGFYNGTQLTCMASITTSSLDRGNFNIGVRFYNTSSILSSGTINLNGRTIISGSVTAVNYFGNASTLTGVITNPFTGSFIVSGSVNVNGPITGSRLLLTGNELNIGTTNLVTKSINLGQIETLSGQDGVSGRADQNTVTFNRNLDIGTDAIHTRINFNGRHWERGADELYYADPDINNHFLQFNSKPGPDQFVGVYTRIIDLQFRTQPRGSSAKGFSTDYNGTTYFNVTGSVSASAYFGNGSTLSGVVSNPFTGSFLITGSLGIIGPTSVNGPLSVTGSLTATGSVVITGSVNLTEGVNGVFIGEGLGSRTTNLVVGEVRALASISGTGTSGQNNIAIGSGSLLAATTTFRNIALGNNVLPTITTNGSNSNIGIGFDVLTAGSTSLTNNIAIGNSACFSATGGDNNIAIGTEALFSNQSSGNNIAIGLRAGRTATGATTSIFIGTDAGANVSSGDNNIAIGFEALKLLTTVSNNIAIGYQAMVSGSGAQDSIAIGASALRNITTGDDNLAIGANALSSITTAAGNLAIGTDSMISTSPTLASNNTSIGFQSLQNITGSNNVALGYRTMQSFRSGSNNTVIGYNNIIGSGVSGSNNTLIGANIVLPDGVHNNRIIIADGQGTQRISVSGSLTTISGSLTATSFTGSFTGSIIATGSLTGSFRGSIVATGSLTGSFTGSFTGSIFATGRVSQTVGTLGIVSSTASLDLSTGNFFTLTLAASSVTHINPTNITAGQTTTVLITTAAGSDVTFPSSVKQQSGSAYVTSPGSAKDILTFISYDTSNIYVANVKNLI